jgi:transcriptional regulator with XRE-family HTH domain
MDVGQRIREVREELGMPQTVLARRVGVARNTIGRYESGEREPSVAMLEKLARVLRTEPAEFLREPVPLGNASHGKGGEQGADPLDGWIGRALSEGDFALEFERAKSSQELADELHRAKIAESDERHQVWDTRRKNDAPPAEILEARRDLAVSNAQLTAAAFLAAERWRGRDVSQMDPRAIVADVLRNQREFLTGGHEGGPTAQAGESA